MFDVLSTLVSQFQQQSLLELVAVLLALAYVWLAARDNIWCWPCAFFSTASYIWVFWEVSLIFNSLLNIFYLIMAIYGWVKWRPGKQKGPVEITSWPAYYHILACSLLLVLGVGLSQVITSPWKGFAQYLDAMVMVFSVYTTFLVAHKVIENWLFWIVINCFAAYLYTMHGLVLTGMLFISYFIFAIYGYLNWRKIATLQTVQE